jgi:hypothetical protein
MNSVVKQLIDDVLNDVKSSLGRENIHLDVAAQVQIPIEEQIDEMVWYEVYRFMSPVYMSDREHVLEKIFSFQWRDGAQWYWKSRNPVLEEVDMDAFHEIERGLKGVLEMKRIRQEVHGVTSSLFDWRVVYGRKNG